MNDSKVSHALGEGGFVVDVTVITLAITPNNVRRVPIIATVP